MAKHSGLENSRTQKRHSTPAVLKRVLSATLSLSVVATGVGAFYNAPKAEAAADILSNAERGVIFANSRTDFRDESIYFLITTRFYDGDPSNNARTSEDDNKAHNPEDDPSWRGDFKGLIDKLDYIKALGFTAIWITPVVQNDSGYDYHGYHAYDFSAVDYRYESNGVTYQDLIDACHAKGMKIIQDVVLNHTCNWGEKNLLQIDDPVYGGGRSDYVMPSGASKDPDNIYHHNGFCGGSDWDNYSAQNKTIADDCFDLETENPKVYNYLIDCYNKYIEMGVDGFRVDTVKHISRLTFNSVFMPAFKKTGGEDFYMFGEVCTKGHDVWYRGEPGISTCFYTWAEDGKWANCWTNDLATNESLVEEHYTAHSDTSSQPTSDNAFLNGNEYHAPDYSQKSDMNVIDFQMHWSFINANNAFNTALGQDKYFNDSTWNVVYVDSHDYAPDECQTVRYTGGTDAWAENLSLMFTFRGIPCIYYGSEVEFQKGKPIDVGPSTQLANTGRAYYGDYLEGTVTASDFTVFGNVSGTVSDTLQQPLAQHLMRLNRIRQAIPALRKGQYSTEGCSGNIAFKRRYTDSTTDSFACVAISGNATFSGVPNGKYVDAVTGDVQNVTNGTLKASVSGKGNMKVYVLDTAKTPAPGRVIPNGIYLTDGGANQPITGGEIAIINPTSITLDKTSVTVKEATTAKVTATIAPADATNKSVTWTTSDASVATVAGGTITGVSKGTATITAKTSNGLTATVKVTVTENTDIVKPTGITLDKTSLTLTEGDSDTLTATVTPSNATNKTVTWTSSDTSVATVDGSGNVKAVSAGTATITAQTFNGYKATATVTVEARQITQIKGIYFEKPSNWGSNVNVYFFKNNADYDIGWPGHAMKDLGNGIYGYEFESTDPDLMIVINDGGSNKTEDLKYVQNGYYTINGFQKVIEPTTQGKVTVKYVTDSGTVLSSTTLTGEVGASYTTSAKSFDGYTLSSTPSNASGKYTEADITVTYVYKEITVDQLVNNSTISSTSITKGKSVTLTGKASGGTSPYQYAMVAKHSTASSYTVLKNYDTTTTKTWTPSKTGTYYVQVKVKDSNGTVVVKSFTLKVQAATTALTNSSTLSATSITKGKSVTMTGKASGGTSPYQYAMVVRHSTASTWTTLKGYNTTATKTWTPAKTGTYTV
ncbi:MAG: alpha-amylase family glycosyl hydrolase, partial [Acutalibacteraceae bacterium]